MKNRNYAQRTYPGRRLAAPAIILPAITATIIALVSICEAGKLRSKTQTIPAAPHPRPHPRTTTRARAKRRDSAAKTDSNGDPINPPSWFERELRRIEAGLDESQKPAEQRGRRAKR